jgi:hypothetical protein
MGTRYLYSNFNSWRHKKIIVGFRGAKGDIVGHLLFYDCLAPLLASNFELDPLR